MEWNPHPYDMASPYDGIAEEDLLGIKAHLLRILKGDTFASQNVPGLSYARRIDSIQDVRNELVLVNMAIDALDPDTAPIDRVYMRAL